MEEQRLYVFSGSNYIMCTDSVTKVFLFFPTLACSSVYTVSLFYNYFLYTWSQLKHCRVGQTVRVTSDVSLLRQQHGGGVWTEEMVTVSYWLASAK